MSDPASRSLDPDTVEAVREVLSRSDVPLTPERVADALRRRGRPVGVGTVLAVHDALRRDVLGAGALEPLLRTPGVTDVVVNGPAQVMLDRGEGWEGTDVRFPDDAAVRRLAQRLAASGGRRLDDASPHVDLRLADGSRFHAVLAPVSRPGTVISLRVPRRRVFTLEELADAGTLVPETVAVVRAVVARQLRFLVSGGTGSGKTTLLNAMLSLAAPDERLVLVEDASELFPAHPHVVGLQGRPPNIEGAGEVTIRDLVRQALRMRPDRLVVGEVRGAEVTDLLAALNTGHDGGCGTLHAHSADDVPARIEALAMAAGLSREAAHSQLRSAVDVLLHLRRGPDGRRRLEEVAMLVEAPDGRARVDPALTIGVAGEARREPGWARLVAASGLGP